MGKNSLLLLSILANATPLILLAGDVALFLSSSCGWRPVVYSNELNQTYAQVFYIQYLAGDTCLMNIPEDDPLYLNGTEGKALRAFARCEKSDSGQFARVNYTVNPYGHDFNGYQTIQGYSIAHFLATILGVAFFIIPLKFPRVFPFVWKPFITLYALIPAVLMIMFSLDISVDQLKCNDIDENVARNQLLSTITLPLYFLVAGTASSSFLLIFYWNIQKEIHGSRGLVDTESNASEDSGDAHQLSMMVSHSRARP